LKELERLEAELKDIVSDFRIGKEFNIARISDLTTSLINEVKENNEQCLEFVLKENTEDYLSKHQLDVAILSASFGIEYEYSNASLHELVLGALLHDIGLVKVPEEILNASHILTEQEYETIKKHPEIGVSLLLEEDTISANTLNIIYQHHERIDGSGYPNALVGEEISEFARIVAIADSYSALTSSRPFRNKRLSFDAMSLILPLSGEQYDLQFIEVFLKIMPIYPVGAIVKLNDGCLAKVIKATGNPFRPVVKVNYTQNIEKLAEPVNLDLSQKENFDKYILKVINDTKVVLEF